MTPTPHPKVTQDHLARDAYLYIRQSSTHQVIEHAESAKRQLALKQRAIELGWREDQIVVIDSDQGQSGVSADDREGFQKMVAEVGLGHVGIVLGLEASRLARSSADWHRLLEICALRGTLILDEDGVYDPGNFNDRLLLGLKGTMSEAELHVLQTRLRGAILSKAHRGELKTRLPVGLVYDPVGRVVLDPHQEVQAVLRRFFETFERTGSAVATVKEFAREGIRFPCPIRSGAHRGELAWEPLQHRRALQVLHNPRYAGAYCYGRTRERRRGSGGPLVKRLPMAEWTVLVQGAHPGYITWEQFEGNQRRLQENCPASGQQGRKSPAREGAALLQGLAICGVCGDRMTVGYHVRAGRVHPTYVCCHRARQYGEPACQRIPGGGLDEAVGKLLVEMVTPFAVEQALAVQQDVLRQIEEARRLRELQVRQARYEAEVAQRRYLQVDPSNRLVAGTLEAEWNEKLRALADAQAEYERHCATDQRVLNERVQEEIEALASSFRRVWEDARTVPRERKRLARLIIEDVTLMGGETITAHVRCKGGTTHTLVVCRRPPVWQERQTQPLVVKEIDRQLDEHTEGEIAAILNAQGLRTGEGHPFQARSVQRLRQRHGLRSRFERLRAARLLTEEETGAALGVRPSRVRVLRRQGSLKAQAYTERPEYLYEHPSPGEGGGQAACCHEGEHNGTTERGAI